MLGEIGDISFSRPSKDISWGVPVPNDATHTMYVWCDALANYITALGYGQEGFATQDSQFTKYWPADVHVVGKDIMKFHSIFWPAMLMSAGLPLPKTIFVHGWINLKGEKMSKSVGNVVEPFALLEKYGKEAVRFYLAHEVPTFGDGDYSEAHFEETYDGFLVKGLGNLTARTLKMMSSFQLIQKPDEASLARYPVRKNLEFLAGGKKDFSFEEATPVFLVDSLLWPKYKQAMANYDISEAIKNIWIFLSRLDEYIEEYKVYKMITAQPEDAKIALWHLAYSLASTALMLKPFLPETADKILGTLGVNNNSTETWTSFSAKEVPHLFPRIKEKKENESPLTKES